MAKTKKSVSNKKNEFRISYKSFLAVLIVVTLTIVGVYYIPQSLAAGRPSGKLSPANGAYWGIYTSSAITNRETQVGRKFVIHQKYYDFTNNFPGASEQDDIANGRIPLDTWQPQQSGGAALSSNEDADIAAGVFDSTIITRAKAIKMFGHPLFLRFAHEMNGNWYPWGGANNGNNSASYVAAWRHVHDIFVQQGATNAVWVWCPNVTDNPSATTAPWNHWTNYYPGDNYVDWVAVDGYNWGNTTTFGTWQSFASVFGNGTPGVYADYAAIKPFMIAETASAETGAPAGTSKRQWITDMSNSMQTTLPLIQAFLWFDTIGQSGVSQWPIDSSADSLNAYTAVGQQAYFNPTVNFGKTGDLNLDGQINIQDLSVLLSDWGATNNSVADLNHDNKVDINDLSILLSNWGT